MLLKPQFSGQSPQAPPIQETNQFQNPAQIPNPTGQDIPSLPRSTTSVLEDLGLLRPKAAGPISTPEILERNDLTVAATLEQLGDLIKTSQSESIRIQAIKMLMEMHQLLKPQIANGGLIVSINIIDSEAPKGLNPILIPRPEASILDMSILPQNVENHAV